MTNEDAIIAPSQSQLFGPKMVDMGASVGWALNQTVLMSFLSCGLGSFSLVTKA